MKKIFKYIPCITTVAIMLVIFNFSAQNAQQSSQSSSSFISLLIDLLPDFLFSQSKDFLVLKASNFVRKMAHFTIFATLGVSVYCMFFNFTNKAKAWFLMLISVLFCFLYACSDEIHQIFVPGRSCQLNDIIVDTIGAFTGICFTLLFIKILRRHKR